VGYVAIPDFENYGLSPGIPYPPNNSTSAYGVTMFHWLHCLVSQAQSQPLVVQVNVTTLLKHEQIVIRECYYDLPTGRLAPDDFKIDSGMSNPSSGHQQWIFF
jgi:hypothetical protein